MEQTTRRESRRVDEGMVDLHRFASGADEDERQARTRQRNPFDGAPVVHAYSRAQALEDGVLVDVTETAREAGWKWPVALTATVYDRCVRWTDEDTRRKPRTGQDERGRLWDVVCVSAVLARGRRGIYSFLYRLTVVPRPGYGRKRTQVLKCSVGPGDDGGGVVTIMYPGEE